MNDETENKVNTEKKKMKKSPRQEKTRLRRMIDAEENEQYVEYLRIRLLKERRTEQENKALARSNNVTMIPLRLERDMRDVYTKIDLDEDYKKDFDNIYGKSSKKDSEKDSE